MKLCDVSEVKAAIAWHVLGDAGQDDALGDIRLMPHQRDGAGRCLQLLGEHRGALLADDVGLGKTYVALAVAREARAPCVIAPAALRETWTRAAALASLTIQFVSIEALSRNPPRVAADLFIVDEAHHLRNRRTRRFAAAAELCANSRVLLLSATPVQNRLDDLRAILSLFLGERALAMTDDGLSPFVVRRLARDVATTSFTLPDVRMHHWVPSADVDCLDHIVALPAGVPPVDGDDGGALVTYTLTRQWASSRAALRAGLERRLARACALEDSLAAGRHPTRAELLAWRFSEGAQQLAFPELVVTTPEVDGGALLERVRLHARAVRSLLAWLDVTPNPDEARAVALRAILRAHPGERVVAFSEYAETATALYGLLVSSERAASLTHSGGRVATGPLTRREIIERFGPGSSRSTHARDRIDILLSTDVLSEGVNLQDASVVVHLDLSWNPARLEQRVGRLRRIGAARGVVSVYAFAPPAPADRLLKLEQRLSVKLGVAARAMGLAGAILPGLTLTGAPSSAQHQERIQDVVRRWRRGPKPGADAIAAAVRADRDGALACVRVGGEVVLVSILDAVVRDDRRAVATLLAADRNVDTGLEVAEAERFCAQVEGWLHRRHVTRVVDLPAVRVAGTRRALLQRVDTVARRVPRHRQAELAPLVRAARTAAGATLSAGAERVLDQLARAPLTDDAWLQAVGEFAAIHARDERADSAEVLALLVFRKQT